MLDPLIDNAKLAAPSVIPPVTVAIISEGTGSGGGTPLTTGTVGTTPDHQPNVVLRAISPVVAIIVRFINAYLTTVVGLITAAETPLGAHVLPARDFYHLFLTCSSLAVAGPIVDLAKNLITIFGKLESKFPLGTGSI